MSVSLVEVSLAAFVILAAIGTAIFRDVMAAIVVFAAYSLGMAVLYTLMLAPDVAMTEAAIGAGVTTILLIVTIAKTNRSSAEELIEVIHWPAVVVAGTFTAVVAWTVFEFPTIGSDEAIAWSNPSVTQHYLTYTYVETGVTNAVTAVLAAYRGFDTFGEAVVVFAVGVAVLVVLDREVFT